MRKPICVGLIKRFYYTQNWAAFCSPWKCFIFKISPTQLHIAQNFTSQSKWNFKELREQVQHSFDPVPFLTGIANKVRLCRWPNPSPTAISEFSARPQQARLNATLSTPAEAALRVGHEHTARNPRTNRWEPQLELQMGWGGLQQMCTSRPLFSASPATMSVTCVRKEYKT